MSLADEYRRQSGWRDWPIILDALPPLEDRTVLDLGCGEGAVAAELVGRGARVIGVDLNDDLLRAARARGLGRAEFREADLRDLPDPGGPVDGLWSSFAAAYFPDLAPVLEHWRGHLEPGGWVALTEVDDLFGHAPIAPRTKSLLDAFARELLEGGWYDFHMGRKLAGHLERAGFTVSRTFMMDDRELAFDGPAAPDIIDAWRRRFDRMTGLQDFCGNEFKAVREDFVGCLERTDHRSTAKVVCCISTG